MNKIELWLSHKLLSISKEKFATNFHRKHLKNVLKYQNLSYYCVPIAKGVSTAFLSTPKENIQSKNILVVVFHGLGHDCTYPLIHLIKKFNEEGISVLSVDWDGHGEGNQSLLNFSLP